MPNSPSVAPATPCGVGLDDRAEIGGEGEQRSRDRLRRAVAGEKRIVADPARRHERLAQQRQDHVAAAEHQRARAIERVEQRRCPRTRAAVCKTGSPISRTKNAASTSSPARRDTGMATWPNGAGGALRQSHRPRIPPSSDRPDLGQRRAAEQDDQRATTAMEARSRSGHSERAMPHTACATMATATSLRPWSKPVPAGPLSAPAP